MEKFVYDDKIVRMFLFAMIGWGIVAFLVGLIVALLLMLPGIRQWCYDNGWVVMGDFLKTALSFPYLQFGRLRPLHTNAAIFAFAGNAIFAGIYYSTQRLCKTRMASDLLSKLHFWGWQLIIVCAALTLPLGITQGKEYAELEWPIDLMIAVVWLVFFGGNFLWTLLKRRERHMYVALWFYIATIVTVTILHVFNNIWVPVFGGAMVKSYSIYAGAQDAMMQWWYGHNAVAFFLTTPFLGMMYYFLPKAAQRPVFSYKLSIIHFWSLVFIYIWAGPHHLHYSPIADWASTLGMVFSLMLWMPSWGGMINGLLTLRGAWHRVASDPVLKFFVVAITFYGMSTFEGPMLSIKAVNGLAHYTDWIIAHVHSGALGWNGMLAFGMMYWLLPRLYQTRLFSTRLAEVHFWVATIGILIYIIPIYVAGITQGLMWRAMNDVGQPQYEFVETVSAIMPMYYLRAIGGTLFLIGALVGFYNFIRTWMARPAVYEEPVHQALPLALATFKPEVKPVSKLNTVADVAKKIDVFSTMWFHRVWERMPVKFTLFVIISVLIASLFELVPTFVIRSNIPTIASVQPYTPLELYGRDVYIANGCYNCHSQNVRPMLAETKRYGEYSKPGEFVYDHPFQWGSRRIGPDLHRVGTKPLTADWHVRHFEDPQQSVPGSIMPPYSWLMTKKLDFESIPARIRAMQILGVPYPQYEGDARNNTVADARAQAAEIAGEVVKQGGQAGLEDKEVVALIAYLNRLGTDLGKPAPTAAPAPVPAPVQAEAKDAKPNATESATEAATSSSLPLGQINAGGR
jgi:cytochrome c oxidase cbb3-type subunit I/II